MQYHGCRAPLCGSCSEQVEHPAGWRLIPPRVGRFSIDLRAVPTLVGPDQIGPTFPQFALLIEILVPFRVVLDTLAPDSVLIASPGFKLEPGQTKPTQIQKARFNLKSNRVGTTARDVPETTVDIIEDSVASFCAEHSSKIMR